MNEQLFSTLEFPKRTIFCNPEDKRMIADCVLSKDISILTTQYLSKGDYVTSKDIICEPKLDLKYGSNDFERNLITVIATPTFK